MNYVADNDNHTKVQHYRDTYAKMAAIKKSLASKSKTSLHFYRVATDVQRQCQEKIQCFR